MTWIPDPALERLRSLAMSGDGEAREGQGDGGRYEILEVVGEGAMGTVHRARDRALGRDVAVKILRAGFGGAGAATGAATLAERMRREALILANLEHPGIVPIHDVGALPDGRVYYAMKLVRGRRLDDAVRDLPTVDAKLRVFLRICEAVAFAHARGVIHRDLKPENVMVGSFGEVLVMDWGVARVLHAPEAAPGTAIAGLGPGGTAAGAVLGTPGYMAPEQAAGGADRADERSDVYALGAVLAFLLAGTHPAMRGPLPIPLPGIARPLAAICHRALAHDPADRYTGVPALLEDVAHYLSGARVAAYPEPVWDRVIRILRPYRVAILLVLAYLVMRALLLFWTRR